MRKVVRPKRLRRWVSLSLPLHLQVIHIIIPEVLDVFYAIPLKGTKADWVNKQLKPWEGFCRRDKEGRGDGATFTDVPGQHYTLMDFDHVPFFQKIFRERLEARGI